LGRCAGGDQRADALEFLTRAEQRGRFIGSQPEDRAKQSQKELHGGTLLII
jgi:hypothetical protein